MLKNRIERLNSILIVPPATIAPQPYKMNKVVIPRDPGTFYVRDETNIHSLFEGLDDVYGSVY